MSRSVRTAIDTNIISALWSAEPLAAKIAQQLGEARSEGELLISPIVYAELLAYPGVTGDFVKDFLDDTGIRIDFLLMPSLWHEAGRRFAQYADRRRQSGTETPKRLLADFVVGAHALLNAHRLMTLDATRYKQDFPELQLHRVGA